MGEDPGEIREQIEATRDRMSETADALAYKANVRARVTEKATAKKDALLGRARRAVPANRQEAVEQISATKLRLVGTARGVATNPRQAREQFLERTRHAAVAVRGNPQVIGVTGGLAVVLALAARRRARRAGDRVSASTTDQRARAGRTGDTDRRGTALGRRRTDASRRGPTSARGPR